MNDPLAYARETPDVSALITEFEQAQLTGAASPTNISQAEDIRYNRWPGKSDPPDGCRWQKNNPQGQTVHPYDGRPDTDVLLTDELCEAEIDMDLMAHAMAQLGAESTHLTQLTAAQAGELKAVARRVKQVIAPDLVDNEELAAQVKATAGWAVLNPGWLERYSLIEREIDLETLTVQIAQLAGVDKAKALATAILDPTFEDAATQAVNQLFAYIPAKRARKIVKELRTTGHATFLDRKMCEKRPTVRTLIPGYNYFVLGTAGELRKARGHLVVERFFQADLEAVAADAGWNEDFVAAVVETAGSFSAVARMMEDKSRMNLENPEELSIEIWTTHVYQFDKETGAGGIYCTTFSPHVRPGQNSSTGESGKTEKKFYAAHYLLSYAHGQAPFIACRREVTGPSLNDSRGVPEVTRSTQKVIKELQDAGVARAQLEVNPPLLLTGSGWSKVENEPSKPGAIVRNIIMGTEARYMERPNGNPQVAEVAIERLMTQSHRQFGLPDADVHPARWQPRQLRKSRRALSPWEQVYWQLTVLCYQELSPQELEEIIGHPPQLTTEDLLRHRVTLTFDARALDNDWRKDTLAFVIQLLTIDKGGLMDTSQIIRLVGSMWDPTMMDAIIRDPAGAQAAVYRQVEQDMMSIMDGNPPQMVENDATAEMQMKMAFQIVGQNTEYQRKLMNDPRKMESLQQWVKNRQHSNQETMLSPMQGRLGVQQMPERPVMSKG